ncbi:hypothetical protein BH10ACT11_BH10ACT11_18040 [soil metagenome]
MSDPTEPPEAPEPKRRSRGVQGPDPLSELELDFTPRSQNPPTLETPEFVPNQPLGSGFEADMADARDEAARRATGRPKGRPRGPGGKKSGGKSGVSETMSRFLVAIPLAALAIATVVLGGGVFAAGMAAFSAGALIEFYAMTSKAKPFASVGVAVAIGLVVAAYFGDQYQMMIVALAALPMMFIAGGLRHSTAGLTGSLAVTALGVMWIALPFSHAVLLRELPNHGSALVLDVLIATFLSDTTAYLGGRAFGRHPLAPTLSPNKTVEGFAFGLLGATLGFWFAGLYQDWLPGLDALALGAAIAIAAPMGDLFQSMIKRDLDVKDAGSIFGPHGGILDRLDAVLFTIVVGYYLSVALVY